VTAAKDHEASEGEGRSKTRTDNSHAPSSWHSPLVRVAPYFLTTSTVAAAMLAAAMLAAAALAAAVSAVTSCPARRHRDLSLRVPPPSCSRACAPAC
jgi:VIT1/CCC1 family predicted Fe2+/Mn2+ transporter